jgi:hypothetical protein
MTLTPLTRFVARVNLADLGILLGLGLVAYGIFRLSTPAGYIFVGLIVVALNVIAGLPPSRRAPSAPKGEQ